jgi:hypothetical protein
MAVHTPTRGEKAILVALNSAPDKKLSFAEIRKAAGLTPRGFGLLQRRLRDVNCVTTVCVQPGSWAGLQLTFGGTRALRAAGVVVS